jgi:cob(I)alamin adenosyltransferase
MITDQGSNFVRLLKQKGNTFFIDEKDNVEVTQIDEVEKEIEQINDELNEVKSFALSNDIDDDADEFVEND